MWKHLWLLTKRTALAYSRDECSQMAAAISYYVLFSIIPLAIFAISVFAVVVRDEGEQEDVANKIVDVLDVGTGVPLIEANAQAIEERHGSGAASDVENGIGLLTEAQKQEIADALKNGEAVLIGGRSLGVDEVSARSDNAVVNTIRGLTRASGAFTVLGLLVMMWSASSMFGAIRRALSNVWGVRSTRPLVRQKLVDLAMVAGIALLLVASIAATATLRALRELSDEDLTRLSTGAGAFWSVLPYVLPAVLTFLVFLAAYRYLPDVRHTFAEVWPGALLATVCFELLKNGFALYVAKFGNYAGAYGALGGILLFMLWTYLSASILLIGAELASENAKLHRDEIPILSTEPARSAGEQVRRYVRGLFFSHHD